MSGIFSHLFLGIFSLAGGRRAIDEEHAPELCGSVAIEVHCSHAWQHAASVFHARRQCGVLPRIVFAVDLFPATHAKKVVKHSFGYIAA